VTLPIWTPRRDIHLDQDGLNLLSLAGAAVDFKGQPVGVHRVDQVEHPDGLFGLVRLQVPMKCHRTGVARRTSNLSRASWI